MLLDEETHIIVKRRRWQRRVEAGFMEFFRRYADGLFFLSDCFLGLGPRRSADAKLMDDSRAPEHMLHGRERLFQAHTARVRHCQNLLAVEPRPMVREGEPVDEVFHEPAYVKHVHRRREYDPVRLQQLFLDGRPVILQGTFVLALRYAVEAADARLQVGVFQELVLEIDAPPLFHPILDLFYDLITRALSSRASHYSDYFHYNPRFTPLRFYCFYEKPYVIVHLLHQFLVERICAAVVPEEELYEVEVDAEREEFPG